MTKFETRSAEISFAEGGISDEIQRLKALKISDDLSIVEEPMLAEIHRLKAIKICDEVPVMPVCEEKTLDLPTDQVQFHWKHEDFIEVAVLDVHALSANGCCQFSMKTSLYYILFSIYYFLCRLPFV